jgi:hypothetical protein
MLFEYHMYTAFIDTWLLDCIWNVMAHVQKPDFVFRRNGRVHLNRQGRQFSRLLAAEVCISAVAMLDTPCSEVVWWVLATHSICQFPLHFPSWASPCHHVSTGLYHQHTYTGVCTCTSVTCSSSCYKRHSHHLTNLWCNNSTCLSFLKAAPTCTSRLRQPSYIIFFGILLVISTTACYTFKYKLILGSTFQEEKWEIQ